MAAKQPARTAGKRTDSPGTGEPVTTPEAPPEAPSRAADRGSATTETKPEATPVAVLQRKSGLSLVEWTGEGETLQRAWVPSREVKQGAVANPDAGVPYGLDFAKFVKVRMKPEDINREMRRAGIWTIEDLRSKPQQVMGALIAAYGVTFGSILDGANQYEQEMAKQQEED